MHQSPTRNINICAGAKDVFFVCYIHILGYPTRYSQPNFPIKWSQKVAMVWCGDHTGKICPKPAQTYRGHHARDPRIDAGTPPSPTTGAGAQKPKVRPSPETDAARRRARQSIREYDYELIWSLQQVLRAVPWPHWRLRCMQPLHGHGMRVVRP